jgi:hypothetical protein
LHESSQALVQSRQHGAGCEQRPRRVRVRSLEVQRIDMLRDAAEIVIFYPMPKE